MNNPPSLCSPTCPRWCHINPPSRVTNPPPADAAPLWHRGSLTSASRRKLAWLGAVRRSQDCPLGGNRGRPARRWDGLDLPEGDALGVVIGQSCRRPFDRPYNLRMRCWGRWAWMSAHHVIWGVFGRSYFFVVPRSPRGILTTRPDRESTSAYTSYLRRGSWLTVTMHFLTVHVGGHQSLTSAWRCCGSLGLLSNRAHARVYCTPGMLFPHRMVSKLILNEPGTKRQRYVYQPFYSAHCLRHKPCPSVL